MREAIISIILAVFFTLVVVGDCGVEPPKPVIPVGCSDLQLECQCNFDGTKCSFVWKCVPIK